MKSRLALAVVFLLAALGVGGTPPPSDVAAPPDARCAHLQLLTCIRICEEQYTECAWGDPLLCPWQYNECIAWCWRIYCI